jgi:hypothetical protein
MRGASRMGPRVEAPLFRLAGIDAGQEQGWLSYTVGLLVFNGLGVLAVYALQRLQGALPLNPQDMAAVSPDSAFNTAVSFVTNTNWQGYGGESSMSYLTQMLALDGAELPVGRDRHRRGHRADPRLRAPFGAGRGQRLGGPDPHHPVDPVAAVVRLRAGAGRPGCDPEPEALPACPDAGGRHLAAAGSSAPTGSPSRTTRARR